MHPRCDMSPLRRFEVATQALNVAVNEGNTAADTAMHKSFSANL